MLKSALIFVVSICFPVCLMSQSLTYSEIVFLGLDFNTCIAKVLDDSNDFEKSYEHESEYSEETGTATLILWSEVFMSKNNSTGIYIYLYFQRDLSKEGKFICTKVTTQYTVPKSTIYRILDNLPNNFKHTSDQLVYRFQNNNFNYKACFYPQESGFTVSYSTI